MQKNMSKAAKAEEKDSASVVAMSSRTTRPLKRTKGTIPIQEQAIILMTMMTKRRTSRLEEVYSVAVEEKMI